MRHVALVWRENRQRWFSDFDWSQRCWCQLISLQIWRQTECQCDLARHSFCPMLITWAEVEFLFSWKCLPHRSFCIVGEPTLPSLISFLSWFREKCSHTILRKSARKPLCQSQSGAPSSREVIIDAVLRLQRLGSRAWTTSKHALCSWLPLSRLESHTIQACPYPPSSCEPTLFLPLLL